MSVSGEEEGKRVERWKGAADAFEYDKSQTLLVPVMIMMMIIETFTLIFTLILLEVWTTV